MGRIVEGATRGRLVEEKVDPEVLKKVRTALEKAGYKLPELKTEAARREFVEIHRYDPRIVINSTVQMAKVFRDWRKRISPAPREDDEEE